MISEGRHRSKAEFQIYFRLLKGVFFFAVIVTIIVLLFKGELTVGDLFVSLIAFLPSGWAIIQVKANYKIVVVVCGRLSQM